MRKLPAGLVTLVFVDIEGSTQLLHVLDTGFDAVRARLRELVRATVRRYGGHEVDWAGDGAFLVFGAAVEAVAAAADIQRAVAAEPWPGGITLRLRVGIRSGAPRLGEEGYVGVDVHAAARICAAAHGGQVVVAQSTSDLAGDVPAVSFRPLGSFRLKGFPGHEELFQLVAPGLPTDFPPLRTLSSATLPALHHRLVGRTQELAAIRALLDRGDARLITITGPGGAGKSRLVLEIAAGAATQRPVHLVGLASIGDPDLVPAAIARAVGARESADTPLVDTVAETLAGSGALLVLDNLEHLVAAAPTVARILDIAPDVDILATSRTPLRLTGERVLAVSPLPLADARTLFSELAAEIGVVLPSNLDDDVAEICRRLDGLPLAIELVVARLTTFPPNELLAMLDDGLALTMTGPVDLPDRQRTLRATIGWSYGLLTQEQREIHEALAVFAGGCRLVDARAVADAGDGFTGGVEALVTGGLLRSDSAETGETRLSMLETVREFATSRLAADGSLEAARTRHADHFLALAVAAEDGLAGADQASVMEELEREHDNLRAALDWSLATGSVDDALRAVSALGRFWRGHGHVSEARGWLRAGLESPVAVPAAVRAKALWTEAHQAMAQSDAAAALPALDEALELFRELGDDRSVVFALCELCLVRIQAGDLDEAETLGLEALATARDHDDPRALSAALNTLGILMDERTEYVRARELYAESLALRRTLGNPLLVLNSVNNLAVAALRGGDLEAAESGFEECLALADELDDAVHRASALCALGEIALATSWPDRASPLLLDALVLYGELGDDRMRAECLHVLGGVAAAEDRAQEAAQLWGAADALRERLGASLVAGELDVDVQFRPRVEAALGTDGLERARWQGRRADPSEIVGARGHGAATTA